MLFLNDAAVTDHKAVLNVFSQFTNIPREIVLHQNTHHLRADTENPFPLAGIELFDKVINQVRNIFTPLFERRQIKFDHGHAEIEIVAIFPLRHQFFQVSIGCGYDSIMLSTTEGMEGYR